VFGAGQQTAPPATPPSRLATAKGLRCAFPLNATGTWKKDGQPDAGLKTSSLVLIFESINTEDGTAKLRNGTMESEVVVRSVTGYLHLMQSFRSGPLYTTTVFDKESSGGKFKAVHSRHEYFTTPLVQHPARAVLQEEVQRSRRRMGAEIVSPLTRPAGATSLRARVS
jgi:hypothetical protein